MTETIPQATPPPLCVACVGDSTDPATRQPCQRCKGTGIDPDPAAPTGIIPLSAAS